MSCCHLKDNFFYYYICIGSVAKLVERRACDQKIAGSIPVLGKCFFLKNFLGGAQRGPEGGP